MSHWLVCRRCSEERPLPCIPPLASRKQDEWACGMKCLLCLAEQVPIASSAATCLKRMNTARRRLSCHYVAGSKQQESTGSPAWSEIVSEHCMISILRIFNDEPLRRQFLCIRPNMYRSGSVDGNTVTSLYNARSGILVRLRDIGLRLVVRFAPCTYVP